ncbi:apolipoprotein N-acyltransferase [Roseobacter sp. CCS2]|uniref:apolipoprotein N-acyltransferase n=1 Tax=Roseobacter sp. CCS2 TaxID=391593 RepID=UPI0000F3E186|nr:apolipoprotein N-acyltransferase [Roseobacter sp. CCS2]EBA12433.1 apolipoprotein N-acyltransferase [Roseobacter sp. CCS2]
MADSMTQFAAQPAWVRLGSLAVLGAMAGLGQAPFDFWPATILALAALFILYPVIQNARQAALHVWAFGFGYFACSLRWIVEPFLVDIARHGWMAPFALLLMGAGAALFWALAAWLASRLAPGRIGMLGLLLVGAEVLRSLILTGFPWALLGHVWVTTWLAQVAAFGGPHLLTLLTVVCGVAVAMLARRNLIAGLVTLGLVLAMAFVVRSGPEPERTGDDPVVRLVQPNAPQHQKWDPAYADIFLNRLLRLSGEGDLPDLVVWPETAIAYLLNHIEDDLRLLSDAARGAPLVFGIQRRDAQARAYNSLVVMGPGGDVQSIYDKQHLVPFGEYMPGARLLGRIGATGLARNLGVGFTPGTTPGPVQLPGIGAAVPLICYEGIFAEEITYGDTRPRLLLLITNDAWFGQAAGPHQHLAQARLRAIEQGLPMVRVANTGISAMIDAKGRISASLPLGVDGAIDVPLPPALPATLYSRWGDLPVTMLLLLLTFGAYLGAKRDSD